MKVLGFQVDSGGMHPTPTKMQAILNALLPSNESELQVFLGSLYLYHAFLSDKATIAETLHRLLNKMVSWMWRNELEITFNHVKQLLGSDHLLTHFDARSRSYLCAMRYPYGIGLVLSHRMPNSA